MFNRSYLAGVAVASLLVAVNANQASAQCGPGCDGPANWNGISVGIGIGGQFDMTKQNTTDYKYDDTTFVTTADWVETKDALGGAGFIGTVGLGYDWQVRDRLVLGAFTDFDFGKSSYSYEGAGASDNVAYSIDHNNTWSIGGRLGLLTNNTTMVYGLVGYSQADVDINMHDENATNGSFDYSKGMTYKGLLLGAGCEHELGNGFFLKAEYRYTNFDSENFLDGTVENTARINGAGTVHSFEYDDFDLDTHSVRASLVYKFARDHAVEEVSYKDVPPAAPYK